MKTVINDVKIILENLVIENGSVVIEGSKIVQVNEFLDSEILSGSEIFNGNGNYLAPGFIDLHIHGIRDKLVDNGPESLEDICKILPEYGVTGFLPTICPMPKGKDSTFLNKLSEVKLCGTQILGFHLEGPFLTVTGALPPEALGHSDADRVRSLIESARPYKTIFSISPDFDLISDLIPIMSIDNTPVFITHTRADAEQTLKAIDLGACHATHFYNVFYYPENKEPGVITPGAVEAILTSSEVSVDFILDGIHIEPDTVKMVLKCKGDDMVCLITDANIGAGLSPEKFMFGNEAVKYQYKGGPARMVKNNYLAGSGLTMDLVLKNAIEMLEIDLPLAIKMITSNPAKVLHLENQKGKIQAGFDADIVLIGKEMNILATWIMGKKVFGDNKEI